jgi:hypothetical protein
MYRVMYRLSAARRGFRALAAVLLTAGLLAGAGSAGASAAACEGWTGVPPLNPGTSGNDLSGVAVISACNVWTVGSFSSGGQPQTLIEHWDGSAWTVVPSPDPSSDGWNFLNSVQAASPTDIWAVGYSGDSDGGNQTLIVHWNGSSWAQVPSPSPQLFNFLEGVRVLSGTDAWAVGQFGDSETQAPGHAGRRAPPYQTMILHWDGTSWQQVASPGVNFDGLGAVSALSSRDAWAVGSVIAHWNGTRWTQVASFNPDVTSLSGVAASSADSAWTVGDTDNGTAEQTFIEHWNGHRWTRVASPDPGGPARDNTLSAVTVTSGGAWAVGSYATAAGARTLILHWTGLAWTQVTSPSPGASSGLSAVRAQSAGGVWAVGGFSSPGSPGQTLAVHCC